MEGIAYSLPTRSQQKESGAKGPWPDSNDEMEMRERILYSRGFGEPSTPASAVTQNGFIRAGAGLIGNLQAMFE